MYYFNARVTISRNGRPVLKMPTLAELSVTSTWKTIGDTARLKLPGLRHKLETLIKSGDSVVVECGYNGVYQTEFAGYVAEVMPNIPFELRLEDEAYKLKRQQTSGSWASTTLKAVLAHVYPGVLSADVPAVTLAPFRIAAGTSKYKVLERLKEEYGLAIYFRAGQLYAGLAYVERRATETVVYHLQRNVVDSALTFRTADDVRLGVKAVSVLPNNKQFSVEVGDTDGDRVTLHFYNVTTKAALTTMATERLKLLKYEGYKGSITGFGLPVVSHGQAALILDDLYPVRSSRVFVDEVVTTVSKTGGFRRQITLGRKAD